MPRPKITSRPNCSIEGCTEPAIKRGWCSRHYQRWRVHGSPMWEPDRAPNGSGCIDGAGYRAFSTADGKHFREHRLVMAKALGRPLLPEEHVHHVNRNKADNRPENLVILTNAEHRKAHTKVFRSETHKQCRTCLTIKPRTEFWRENRPNRDPHKCDCKECAAKEFRELSARRKSITKSI
jgi:HNH endonuclease